MKISEEKEEIRLELISDNKIQVDTNKKTLWTNYKGKDYFVSLPQESLIEWGWRKYSNNLKDYKPKNIKEEDYLLMFNEHLERLVNLIWLNESKKPKL